MANNKVLVCGSRHFNDRDTLNRVLDAQLAKRGPGMILITGGAVGADNLAMDWARSRKVDHVVRYAKWELEGKAAGPIRNRRMLGLWPKIVIAFLVNIPGENKGTQHMCSIATDAGIKVKRFL